MFRLKHLAVFVAFLFVGIGFSQPFVYQGFLRDNGSPATGNYSVTFRLFAVESGGSPIGTVGPVATSLSNGLFTARLDFGTNAFTGADRWLELEVDSTTLSPRLKIDSVPYAIHSNNTRGLIVDNNLNVGLTSTRKYMGIGTSDTFPYDGKTMGHYALGWFDDTWNPFGATTWLSGYAGIKLFTSGALRVAITQNGAVGIGTASPVRLLQVGDPTVSSVGLIRVGQNGASTSRAWDFGIGDSALFGHRDNFGFRDVSGSTIMVLQSSGQGGRVGIGTSFPAQSLHTTGNIRTDGGILQSQNSIVLHPDVDLTGDDSVSIANSGGGIWMKFQDSVATIYSSANGIMNVRFATTNIANHGVIEVGDIPGTPKAGVYVADNGNGIVWGNIKSFREPDPNDPETDFWYASLEGPEAALYVRGKGRLVNGQALIELPDHFQTMMLPESITVQLTPGARSSKGLAYEEINGQISVFELNDGRGNYDFSWVVTAVRKGYEDFRVKRKWDEILPLAADREKEWEARLKSIELRDKR